jgi:hypothetical protein
MQIAALELVDPPAIADARHLTAGGPAPAVPDHVRMLAAVARVPGRATSPDT